MIVSIIWKYFKTLNYMQIIWIKYLNQILALNNPWGIDMPLNK